MAEQDELDVKLIAPKKPKAKAPDPGYVKALEELLDHTELQHPRVFRGIGWRNNL